MLEKGNTVGIFTSSYPITAVAPQAVESAVSFLESRGYRVKLGKHRKFDDQGTGRTPADILLEVLNGKKIPILADVDCCHTIPMITLPIGGKVYLDAGKQEIALL